MRRRDIIRNLALAASGTLLGGLERVWARPRKLQSGGSPSSVVTPNGSTLPWRMEDGHKVFHLIVEPVQHKFAPGLEAKCWGYNGQTPGPTIEAVEGDHVRILVTNHLPEETSIHWHGMHLPNGMDGVAGLNQKRIAPGQTYVYEFPLRQHGTLMYHPHADEMTQIALGLMGFFIIHPRATPIPVERDFCIFLHEWLIPPGTATPNPLAMTDFNYFTFNGHVYPGTAPLVAQVGQRVRVRLANLSMDSHPIHLHGHTFRITGTPGGPIPPTAQWPETTVDVPPGTTRDIEFVADALGDWPVHCHKTHHAMNAMSHDLPNMLGVDQSGVADRVNRLVPGYMPMGKNGTGEMSEMNMGHPPNTLPMSGTPGPFGPIDMGGMFTILKVREHLTSYQDPGWYHHPRGTLAHPV